MNRLKWIPGVNDDEVMAEVAREDAFYASLSAEDADSLHDRDDNSYALDHRGRP